MFSQVKTSERGFTLIELLVVIAIIGILAAAAIPQVMDALCSSKAGAAKSEISTIRTAFAQCQVSNNADQCNAMADLGTQNTIPQALENDGNWSMDASGTSLNDVETATVGCQWDEANSNNGMRWNGATGKIQSIP